jgi:hypothetical protein
MDFSTPEEGRKLVREIQHTIKRMEESQKRDEIDRYFVPQHPYDLQEGNTCYLAIYISGGHGGIVKVKLEKRLGNSFYFVSIKNDFHKTLKEWSIVNRVDHPYLVSSQMGVSRYFEPIPYSNVENIRNVEILQLKA